MMQKLALIVAIHFGFSDTARSQMEMAQWICGYQVRNVETNPDTGVNKDYGANMLDFRKSPLGISRKYRTLTLEDCNISMCDSTGEFLFFSNGAKIFNRYDSLIKGADSFSYSKIWDLGWQSRESTDYYSGTDYGYIPGKQGLIAIPRPSRKNQFYIVNFFMNTDSHQLGYGYRFTSIHYSILDMNLNNGRGKIILKEKLAHKGNFSPILSACKHGNGIDWWIASQDYRGNKVHILKATKDSVFLSNSDSKYPIQDFYHGANFSNNGKYYATCGVDSGINIFKFNRCDGYLTFYKYLKRPKIDSNGQYTSVGFSPNSRFLYYSIGVRVYQFDLSIDNDSLDRIKINYTDTNSVYQIQQAIDGKLYISTGSSAPFLHTIESPNVKGLAANLKINSVKLKTWNRGIPQFPNYTLGIDSSCDSSHVSITEIATEPRWAVYPNPISDFIYIWFSKKLGNQIRLFITDIQGRVFYNCLRESMTQTDICEISTSKWTEGNYIIQIYDGTRVLFSQKLIIHH